jgi:hypothetical protein
LKNKSAAFKINAGRGPATNQEEIEGDQSGDCGAPADWKTSRRRSKSTRGEDQQRTRKKSRATSPAFVEHQPIEKQVGSVQYQRGERTSDEP